MKIEIQSLRTKEQEKDGIFSKKSINLYETFIVIELTEREKTTIEQHPLLQSVIFLSFTSSLSDKSLKSNIQPQKNNILYGSLPINNKFKIKSYTLGHLTSLRSKLYDAVESFNNIINTTNALETKDIINTDYLKDGVLFKENK